MRSEILHRPMAQIDTELLLKWRNDQGSRKYSRNTKEIAYDEHLEWVNRYFADTTGSSKVYIFEKDGLPIGMTRLDKLTKAVCEISLVVDPDNRGKGLGREMILETLKIASENLGFLEIIAYINEFNTHSLRAFLSCGFKIIDDKQSFLKLHFVFNASISLLSE